MLWKENMGGFCTRTDVDHEEASKRKIVPEVVTLSISAGSFPIALNTRTQVTFTSSVITAVTSMTIYYTISSTEVTWDTAKINLSGGTTLDGTIINAVKAYSASQLIVSSFSASDTTYTYAMALNLTIPPSSSFNASILVNETLSYVGGSVIQSDGGSKTNFSKAL